MKIFSYFSLILTFILFSSPVFAEEEILPINISDIRAFATASRAKVGGAFLTIKSNKAEDDRLLKASASVSDRVELHTHIIEDNVMKMRPIEDIAVPAGETVILEPTGLHIMFMGLHVPLKAGETFPLMLTFEKEGDIEVTVQIKSRKPIAQKH